MKTQVLRRRLLGFSPDDVHQLLAEHDFALGQAMERAESIQHQLSEALERAATAEAKLQAAEERLERAEDGVRVLEVTLSQARDEISRKSRRIDSLAADVDRLQREMREQQAEGPAEETVKGLLIQQLAPIMGAAHESATAMIDEARRVAEEQLAQTEETRRVLQQQGQAVSSWWSHLEGAIRPIMSSLDQTRSQLDSISGRVQEALAPLSNLLATMTGQLAELGQISAPPALEPIREPEQVVDLSDPSPHEAGSTEAPSRSEESGVRKRPWGPVSWWPLVESGTPRT